MKQDIQKEKVFELSICFHVFFKFIFEMKDHNKEKNHSWNSILLLEADKKLYWVGL
jgi:hypothetical protein